ncbi:MAG: 4Fe-4S binding protein [Chloroflexi bacterium]|nr:4Fe-4S binding protein [Chloroflexota bacterium]
MLNQALLEQLTDAINSRGGATPAVKLPQFYDVLNEFFTAEEAEIAVKLPAEGITVKQLAQLTGAKDTGKLVQALESMADRGLLLADKLGDNTTYKLLPLVPGMFEFQFMKGGTSERERKIILLIHEYIKALTQASAAAKATGTPEKKRVVHLDELISKVAVIHSLVECLDLIEKTDDIAVGNCMCRHRGEIVGRPCDKPKELCIMLGPEAKAATARGIMRMITKDEAHKLLDRAEEAGLVHQTMYHQGGFIEFLCNCCVCHCATLKGIYRSPAPSLAAIVKQVIEIDKESCLGCGDCVPRCQMEAIKMEGDELKLDANRCIGCGLCMYTCPADSLKLIKRDNPWAAMLPGH